RTVVSTIISFYFPLVTSFHTLNSKRDDKKLSDYKHNESDLKKKLTRSSMISKRNCPNYKKCYPKRFLQKKFDKLIFNLNSSIGEMTFQIVQNFKIAETKDCLQQQLKSQETEIVKMLLQHNAIEMTPKNFEIISVFVIRRLFNKIGNDFYNANDNPHIKATITKLKSDNSSLNLSGLSDLLNNEKLNELIERNTTLNENNPYDFLVHLSDFLGKVQQVIDINGDNVIGVVVVYLLKLNARDIEKMIVFTQTIPDNIVKGKLSYSKTTLEAAIKLVLLNN
ncbi:hypothetical protein EIN_316430, partial [Entamoeba invadens IP1]